MNFPRLVIAAALIFQTLAPAAFAQSSLILPATQAAHINGREKKSNFGDAKILEIKKSKTGKQDRLCYLQFDLSKSKAAIESAILDCTLGKPIKTPILVGVSRSDWQESRITWDRNLAKVTLVTKAPALGGGRLLVDVTDTVRKAQKAKIKSLTFALSAADVTKKTIEIASDESRVLEERPRLMLQFRGDGTAISTSIHYSDTERGKFAGISPGKISDRESLGKFGGWKQMRAKSTGFFRTVKVDDYWMMVDPEGYAFFGFGLNSVRETPKLKLPQDVKAIGFNHMASWSDESIRNMPFTPRWNFIQDFKNITPEVKRAYLEKDLLPVFDPRFQPFVEKQARKAAAYKNNPWVLGHFTDNEIPFHKTIQLRESLRLPKNNAIHITAKQWLLKKYGRRSKLKDITEEDELQYMGYVADRYYQVVTSALRKNDPNHLILGERLHASAKYNPYIIESVGKYSDVISINFYRDWTPPQNVRAMWREKGKKPFLITEFYAKAANSGLDNENGAGWVVPTQKERVQHFENFAMQMLGTPNCIGFQWFRFVDDEGSNKGVYDSRFQPYQQLQDSMRNISGGLYRLRSQQLFGDQDYQGKAKR